MMNLIFPWKLSNSFILINLICLNDMISMILRLVLFFQSEIQDFENIEIEAMIGLKEMLNEGLKKLKIKIKI